jgi:hypothetical protein
MNMRKILALTIIICSIFVVVVSMHPRSANTGDCPDGYPVNCGTWCCKEGYTCGSKENCCIPPHHGDECPVGSCEYCPVTHPACIGWPGTNYVCCTRDSVTCNVGNDVWCCNRGQMCGDFKGQCK